MPTRTVDSGYSWLVMIGTFGLYILFTINFSSYGVFLPEFVDYFRVSKASAAMAGSLCIGLSGILGLALGPVVKKFGTRIVVMVGGFFAGLGIFVAGYSTNIIIVNILYGMVPGLGTGTYNIGGVVALLEYFEKRRALAIGVAMTGLCLGTFVSPILSRVLIDTYGWRGALVILGGIQLNSVVAGALLKPQVPREDDDESSSTSEDSKRLSIFQRAVRLLDLGLLKDLKVILYLLADAFVLASHIVPFILLPARVIGAGYDSFRAATSMTIFGVCSGALRPFVGFVGDKIGYGRTLVHAGAGITAGSLSIIFYFFDDYALIATYAGFFGALSAGYVSLDCTIIGDLVPSDKLATGSGLLIFTCGVSTLLSPPIAGWIVDITGSFAIPFLVFGFVQIFGGCCGIWAFMLQRRAVKEQGDLERGGIEEKPNA